MSSHDALREYGLYYTASQTCVVYHSEAIPMHPEVLSAIIAGSISLVVSSVVAAWAQRRKLESDYDATLRTE